MGLSPISRFICNARHTKMNKAYSPCEGTLTDTYTSGVRITRVDGKSKKNKIIYATVLLDKLSALLAIHRVVRAIALSVCRSQYWVLWQDFVDNKI